MARLCNATHNSCLIYITRITDAPGRTNGQRVVCGRDELTGMLPASMHSLNHVLPGRGMDLNQADVSPPIKGLYMSARSIPAQIGEPPGIGDG